MKKLAFAALALTAAVSAHAEKGFNASFWAPDHQVVPPSEDIKGVRLNFFYGENRNMTGADIGTANSVTGDLNGAQLSVFLPCVYNYVGGTLNGAQLGIVNQFGTEVNGASLGIVNYSKAAASSLTGAQLSAVNWCSNLEVCGAQLGIVNKAKSVTGAQLGLVNFTDKLKGAQLGLWNMVLDRGWNDIGNKGLGRGFPFINLGW